MKNLLCVICLIMTFGFRTIREDKRLIIAENLIENNPDSTFHILNRIKYTYIDNNCDKALYGLLFSEVIHKLHIRRNSDSLITYSLKYYTINNDKRRLANALYYKAVISYENGKKADAVIYAKRAENVSDKISNELLRNRIYDFLCYINHKAYCYAIELSYAKKMLNSSIKLHDIQLISRGYTLISQCYNSLGEHNKAFLFIMKNMRLIEELNKKKQALILDDLGERYCEMGALEKAKYYALLSLKKYNTAIGNLIMFKINMNKGRDLIAQLYLIKALNTKDVQKKNLVYESMLEYQAKHGNYKSAYILSEKLRKVLKDEDKIKNSQKIFEIQTKYDKEITENVLFKKIAVLLVSIILLVILILLFLYYYKMKVKKYIDQISSFKSKIDIYVKKINQNFKLITRLNKLNKTNEKAIRVLTEKTEFLYQSIIERLRNGYEIYEVVKEKKKIVRYDDSKIECLVDFYKIIKKDKYISWTDTSARKLGTRQYLFLILEDMKYMDSEIADILGVTDSTVRSIRSRIKKTRNVNSN